MEIATASQAIEALNKVLMYCESLNEEQFGGAKSCLSLPICKLAQLLVDNHQKINEIVSANEQGFSVCKNKHGADMTDTNGRKIEHKMSTCTSARPRCDATIHFPKNSDIKKISESIRNKMAGGYLWIEIRDGRAKHLHSYKLSCEFLVEFFKILGPRKSFNFGCSRCKDCGDFHRLRRFQEASDKFDRGEVVDFSQLTTQCTAECGSLLGKNASKTPIGEKQMPVVEETPVVKGSDVQTALQDGDCPTPNIYQTAARKLDFVDSVKVECTVGEFIEKYRGSLAANMIVVASYKHQGSHCKFVCKSGPGGSFRDISGACRTLPKAVAIYVLQSSEFPASSVAFKK